jgi:hypothetical protein
MSELMLKKENQSPQLVQGTIRIRKDQKKRLEDECRAKGGTVADTLRDNLDLAFAMKSELANIAVGQYDENAPGNTTMLVHSLLFRVEERLLAAFEELAKKLDAKGSGRSMPITVEQQKIQFDRLELDDDKVISINNPQNIIEQFVSLVVSDSSYPTAVWLGAFLEIIPRLSMISKHQLEELQQKGGQWLEDQRY